MAFDINKAQFKAFTTFAEGVGGRSVVHAGGMLDGTDGTVREIEAKSGDFEKGIPLHPCRQDGRRPGCRLRRRKRMKVRVSR